MKPAEAADESKDVDMTAGGEEHDTGYYELVAIVSHKGRTADGGHYVGWVKHKSADGKDVKEDQWILFDDETASLTDWKQLVGYTDLQGGKADTQIAYINIYKKVIVKSEGQVVGSSAAPGEAKSAEEAKAAAP